jgi:hypothetical protein
MYRSNGPLYTPRHDQDDNTSLVPVDLRREVHSFSEARRCRQSSPGDILIPRNIVGRVFIDIIPTYVVGAKAFLLKGLEHKAVGIFWVVYMLLVIWKLLDFLNTYYLKNTYDNPAIKKLSDFDRAFIAFSYLLIDSIYPVSVWMLYLFYRSGQFKMILVYIQRLYITVQTLFPFL